MNVLATFVFTVGLWGISLQLLAQFLMGQVKLVRWERKL